MSEFPTAGVVPVSCLMACWRGDAADWLATALISVLDQQVVPAELVLVVDGAVPAALEEVIETSRVLASRTELRVVRLPSNVGLGPALAAGLAACSYEFVARMDADDINCDDRIAEQYDFLVRNPEVSLLAGAHQEIDLTGAPSGRIKVTPSDHDEIVRDLHWRNCISHPTIMFRRSAVLACGGYTDVSFLEDYDLFLRLAAHGARFAARPTIAVQFRVTPAQLERRGGWGYARRELRFRHAHARAGRIPPTVFVASAGMYLAFRLVPPSFRRALYRLVRRQDRPVPRPESVAERPAVIHALPVAPRIAPEAIAPRARKGLS